MAIGINEYRHCPPLFNCVKDAKDLVRILTMEYEFDQEDVTTLFDQEATNEKITDAFYCLARKVTADDNVIIYFSGHGEYDQVLNRGYWIPVEAEEGKIHQYLPNSEVRDFLSAIKSRHTLLMADSCFSGSLFASRSAGKSIIRRYEKDPSRWGLSSGRNEIVSDGKPGDNSPFAESLLYQLRENPDGLGVDELCFKVREYVEANSNQAPIGEPLKVEGHKNGVFVFHRKGSIPKSPTQVIPPTLQQGEPADIGQSWIKGANWRPYAILVAAILTTIIILWQQPWVDTKTPSKPADTAAFKMASDTGTVAAFKGFMEQFPKSTLKPDAQRRLDELEKQNQVFLNDAETFLKAGEPAEARRLLDEVRRINPDEPRLQELYKKLKE